MRATWRMFFGLALVGLMAACGSAPTKAAVRVASQAPAGQPVAATETPGQTVDLAGNAATISIDHTGAYTWTSPITVATPPLQATANPQLDGDVHITGFRGRLVDAPGGTAMQVTFEVTSFTGSPSVTVSSTATEPDTATTSGGAS